MLIIRNDEEHLEYWCGCPEECDCPCVDCQEETMRKLMEDVY